MNANGYYRDDLVVMLYKNILVIAFEFRKSIVSIRINMYIFNTFILLNRKLSNTQHSNLPAERQDSKLIKNASTSNQQLNQLR